MNPKYYHSHGIQGHRKDDTAMKEWPIFAKSFFWLWVALMVCVHLWVLTIMYVNL